MHPPPPLLVFLPGLLCLLLLSPPAWPGEATKDRSTDDLLETLEIKQGGLQPQGERSTAYRELVRRADPATVPALLEMLADPFVHQREVAVLALAQASGEAFLRALAARGLRHREELIRAGVVEALSLSKEPEAFDLVVEARRDRAPLVRRQVALAFLEEERGELYSCLEELARDRDPVVRAAAARALGTGQQLLARQVLLELLRDRDPLVRSHAVESLATADPPSVREHLPGLLEDRQELVRIGALLGARQLGSSSSLEDLDLAVTWTLQAFDDASWRVRATAYENAIELWDERCIGPLIGRLAEEEGRLRLDCAFALTLLCDQDLGTDAGSWRSWWEVRKESFQMPPRPKRGPHGFERRLTATEGSVSFFDVPVLSKAAVFLFDFSGSMAWEIEDYRKGRDRTVPADERTTVTKLSIAQDEAEAVAARLEKDAHFNFLIYRYHGARCPPVAQTDQAFKRLTPATPKAIARARKWVRSQDCDGWGAFYPALVEAMADQEVDTIFLLTDGRPTGGDRVNQDRFLAGIQEHFRDRRVVIHAVLMKNNDDGHNRYAIGFMERLATCTGGLCVLR